MQGKTCAANLSLPLPENAKLFNASNVAWNDIAKTHNSSTPKYNASVYIHEEICDETINASVSEIEVINLIQINLKL